MHILVSQSLHFHDSLLILLLKNINIGHHVFLENPVNQPWNCDSKQILFCLHLFIYIGRVAISVCKYIRARCCMYKVFWNMQYSTKRDDSTRPSSAVTTFRVATFSRWFWSDLYTGGHRRHSFPTRLSAAICTGGRISICGSIRVQLCSH